jgi:5-methylcytosine-specific restriction endonuclease McrA
MKNKIQKCKGCGKEISAGKETGFCNICYARDYRKRNKDKIKPVTRKYYETHKEEAKENLVRWRDKTVFGGNSQKAFERDGWECQECGMSQEQSIMLFNRKLVIHHIDGMGRNSEVKNHDLNNLITLCPRCHGKIHGQESKRIIGEELLEQDDSDWKYPKIRELVDSKLDKETNVTQAKKIIANELNMSFWTIDGYYYMKKTQSKPNENNG